MPNAVTVRTAIKGSSIGDVHSLAPLVRGIAVVLFAVAGGRLVLGVAIT